MRVVAVVVSYNRSALLGESLSAIMRQTRPVDHLVVVDNASTDNSAKLVREAWPEAELICLTENTGGAGGFTVGIAAALRAGADWVWLMDDDTIPSDEAIAELIQAESKYAQEQLVLLGSRAVWTDGADHPMNTPKRKLFVSRKEAERAATVQCMPVRTLSFVSAFVRASRVLEVGLPVSAYFLWNDDFEFSARLARGRRALYVPQSVVEHRTQKRGSSDDDPGERFFFEVRNKLWLFLYSKGFNPFEKALYFGATLRRWLRTFRKSEQRSRLHRTMRQGMKDGLREKPQPNAEVLSKAVGNLEITQMLKELR